MTDYNDLIKKLRDDNALKSLKTLHEAADAIAALENSRNCWRTIAETKLHGNARLLFWHSVKDELPEFECYVLAFCVNGEETRIVPCTYKPSDNFHDCVSNCYAQGVTHWMGLPAPPKEET